MNGYQFPISRSRLSMLFLAGVLGLFSIASAQSPYLTTQGSAWRIASANVLGIGPKHLVYGTYEGEAGCLDPRTGQTLWRTPIGGFPFGLATGDVNTDGRDEIFTACADGRLYAISPEGKISWTFSANNAAIYSVAIVRRGQGSPPLIACGGMDRLVHLLSADGKLIASYDFGRAVNHVLPVDRDGKGIDDLMVIGTRSDTYDLIELQAGKLGRVWRKTRQQMKSLQEIKTFYPAMVDAQDIDGDGRTEVIFGSTYAAGCRIVLADATAEPRWVSPQWASPRTRAFKRRNMYCMTLVRAADVIPASPGKEIIAVTTGNVRIFDREGKLLGEANAPVGFTDIAVDCNTLYLGATPNGDQTIYRIDMSGNWEDQINGLERHGLALKMGQTLKVIQQQAIAHPAAAATGQRYIFSIGSVSEENNWACPPADWFTSRYRYPNFTVIPGSAWSGMEGGLAENMKLNNEGAPLKANPQGKPPDEIAKQAATLEQSGRQVDFYIGHGASPRMTVDTLDRMMQAAPTSLHGFVTHEDESMKTVPGYCSQYLAPLAHRCVARNRFLAMHQKNSWWFDIPAIPSVGQSLFDGKTAAALIAGTDDANSRTPELNLLARVGLRQAGLIAHIQACPITDLNAFNRMQEWEYPKHGHPFFRLMVAHTVLGADHYNLRVDNWHGAELTEESEEGFAPFLHLLGKGLIFAPRPDQMAGLSRIGFAVHQPSEKWTDDGHNGHQVSAWQADAELDNAVLPHNACFWGNTPTPPHALQAVLLRKKRQFSYHVPPTPYGPFVFVPATADLTKVVGVDEWWHTDGISIWRKGQDKLTGQPAADALKVSFEAAAAKLPFRALGDDVFFHSVRLDDGTYRIYAIDPGWLDPANRNIRIQTQLPGPWQLTDALTGENLPSAGERTPLLVPAGALRILNAQPLPQSAPR